MAGDDDDGDGFYAARRKPGRFYVSTRFPKDDPGAPDQRFAYEVFDSDGEVVFESEDGWEVTLRETESRQSVRALFFEDGRAVKRLAFQRFRSDGKPFADKKTLILNADEVQTLVDFLAKIRVAELVGDDGVRFSEEASSQLLAGHSLPPDLLRERSADIEEFLRSDVRAPEVTALARRRRALETFEQMLDDDRPEEDWQRFLEAEPWIVGFGGAPQFLHAVGDKLEQVVKGSAIGSAGKRTDALLWTAGSLSALTFVEIKKPSTPLLRPNPYRPGTWAVSLEVAGGVAQLHATVDGARREVGEQYRGTDDAGYETGEFAELCRPRAVLVVGNLGQLTSSDGRPHRPRFRSFESFRRSLREPEIITFDELLERVRAVIDLTAAREAREDGRRSG